MPLVNQSIGAAEATEDKCNMELSDEQLVLKAWEVAMRRGWAFVIDTLLRTEMESFPHSVHEEGEQERLGDLEGDSPQSPHKVENLKGNDKSSFRTATLGSEMPSQESNFFTSAVDSDNPMVSMESDDEEEETAEVDLPGLNIAEVGVQKSELLPTEDSSLTIPSSCKEPTIQCEDELHMDEPVMHPKIQEFIDEVTIVFNKCFFDMEEPTSTKAPLNEEFKEGRLDSLPDNSTLDSREAAQPEVLSDDCHASLTKVPQTPPPRDSPPLQQVVPVPAMPAVPSAASLKARPPPAGFFVSPPLAGHISKPLREMVVALQFFDMFALLPKDSVDILVRGPERRTLERWQRGFIIMGSILLEDAPEKLMGFFNYFDTIRKAYEQAAWGGWLIYDDKFRRIKAGSPNLSWAFINTELWLQMVNPQRAFFPPPPPPMNPYTGLPGPPPPMNPMNPFMGLPGPPPPLPPPPMNHYTGLPGRIGYCWHYDRNECIKGALCRYIHQCSNCGGDHPGVMCATFKIATGEPDAKKQK
ncbi:uncharacterized protein LOC144768701 [Lissotriton helveticus]